MPAPIPLPSAAPVTPVTRAPSPAPANDVGVFQETLSRAQNEARPKEDRPERSGHAAKSPAARSRQPARSQAADAPPSEESGNADTPATEGPVSDSAVASETTPSTSPESAELEAETPADPPVPPPSAAASPIAPALLLAASHVIPEPLHAAGPQAEQAAPGPVDIVAADATISTTPQALAMPLSQDLPDDPALSFETVFKETMPIEPGNPATPDPILTDAVLSGIGHPTTIADQADIAPAPPALVPEIDFAEANHTRIVSAVESHIDSKGGSMQIRLDPPELGALIVRVQMQDGVVTASFQTTTDDATRLLGHSLAQLKNALQSQGIAVDRLQVQQAPRDPSFNASPEDGSRQQSQSQQNFHEQQRREMLQRLWRRLAGDADPLDLFA